MPALEMHKAKLLLAAAAGRLPDIASVDSFWMPLFLDGGHVQPLEPYWPAEDRADYLPFTIDTLSDAQGHVYGIWHGTDCRLLYYRKDLVPAPPRDLGRAARRRRAASRREKKIAGYLYNAGRWEAVGLRPPRRCSGPRAASWWTPAGGPIFGEPPHREKMVDVLAFLRADHRAAAPRRAPCSSHNDYQQLTSAAIAGDAAMFLGGNWQLARPARRGCRRRSSRSGTSRPIPQKTRGHAVHGHRRLGVGDVRARSRAAARGRGVPAVRGVAGERRPHHPAHRPAARAPQRVPRRARSSATAPGTRKFGGDGRARQGAPGGRRSTRRSREQLQLAVGDAVAGDKTPEQAVDDAWRAVQASDRAGARRDAGGARAAIWLAARPDRSARSPSPSRVLVAAARRAGPAAPVAAARARARRPRSSSIPMLDLAPVALTDTARLRLAAPLHAGELPRPARRARVLRDGRRSPSCSWPASVALQLGLGPGGRGPGRRRAAPGRAAHAAARGRGGERVGDPGRAGRRAVADPPRREPLRHRQLLPVARSGWGRCPCSPRPAWPWPPSSPPTPGAAARSA